MLFTPGVFALGCVGIAGIQMLCGIAEYTVLKMMCCINARSFGSGVVAVGVPQVNDKAVFTPGAAVVLIRSRGAVDYHEVMICRVWILKQLEASFKINNSIDDNLYYDFL